MQKMIRSSCPKGFEDVVSDSNYCYKFFKDLEVHDAAKTKCLNARKYLTNYAACFYG